MSNFYYGAKLPVSQDKDLHGFLTNPAVQRTEKVEVMKALMEKSSVSPLVKNLFVAMAENGALGIADGVLAAFTKIMCAQRKEVWDNMVLHRSGLYSCRK